MELHERLSGSSSAVHGGLEKQAARPLQHQQQLNKTPKETADARYLGASSCQSSRGKAFLYRAQSLKDIIGNTGQASFSLNKHQ